MAHTLFEQEHTFSSAENSAGEINDIFVQQFGYTRNGDYYLSPVDTNFGVRWYMDGSWLFLDVTFDGGATAYTGISKVQTSVYLKSISYHVSMSEKVIYIRINYRRSSSTSNLHHVDIIIAHDFTNNTICFAGSIVNGSSSGNYSTVYMVDKKRIKYTYDSIGDVSYKVRSYLGNSIFRFPSMNNNCLFDELYGIINVQVFPSINNTYINFNGQLFRIITCGNTDDDYPKDFRPYFAFPVSD